jgi:hypothetical protein
MEEGGGEVKTIVFSGESDKKTSAYFKKQLAHKSHTNFFYGGKKTTSKRLQEDHYQKPEKTITDLLQTREAILEKLENYEEIDPKHMELIPKNALISYITFDPEKNMELYRTGGYLRKVAKEYIVLAGKGNKTFSVQRYIYRDRNKSELLYVTRFFGKREKKEQKMVVGGGEEVPKSSKKQQEILEAKSREIEELRARLAILEKDHRTHPTSTKREDIRIQELFDDVSSVRSHKSMESNKSVVSNKSSVSHTSNLSHKSSVSKK